MTTFFIPHKMPSTKDGSNNSGMCLNGPFFAIINVTIVSWAHFNLVQDVNFERAHFQSYGHLIKIIMQGRLYGSYSRSSLFL